MKTLAGFEGKPQSLMSKMVRTRANSPQDCEESCHSDLPEFLNSQKPRATYTRGFGICVFFRQVAP